MADLSLEQLLVEAGPAAPKLNRILTETALNLLESRLIVRKELWHQVSGSDAFAMRFLTDILGAPQQGSWDNETVLGDSALCMLRAINSRSHAYRTTRSPANNEATVADAQGGMFCSMCGSRDNLVVDHIEPVSIGGADEVSNMQLLCTVCNSGKSDLRDRALPIVVRHNTTPIIPMALRFKHLLMSSVIVDGRNRGICQCGSRADSTELQVTIWPAQAAANLLNLSTRCSNCNGGS